jgi:hypothetical protein
MALRRGLERRERLGIGAGDEVREGGSRGPGEVEEKLFQRRRAEGGRRKVEAFDDIEILSCDLLKPL